MASQIVAGLSGYITNPNTPQNNTPNPNTAKNQPFFVDLVTLEKLFFQTIPLSLEYEPKVTLVSLPSYGRNITNYQFTGAEDILKFDMSWYGDLETRDDVIRKCKWLEALSKDAGDGTGLHQVQLCFGQMYTDAKWVMESASYTMSLFNRQYSMFPQLAISKIILRKVNKNNPNRNYILQVNS